VRAGPPRRLTSDAREYGSLRWLPNGSGLVATVERDPELDDLFYFGDIARIALDGTGAEILTGPETADYGPLPSPDGQWIAYLSQPVEELGTANVEVWLRPAAGGDPRLLTAELDRHATNIQWAADSWSLYALVPDRGRVDLRRVRIEGGPVQAVLTGDRTLLSYDISPDGQRAAFVASTDRNPADLFVANLPEGAEQRLTEVNASWLAQRRLGEAEEFWFDSADGTPIHGWIVKPPGFAASQAYPLALEIHGGPHAMWGRHEHTMWLEWQALAARGYLVFACNPRGSDGYGEAFRAGAINAWGEADLPDLQAGISLLLSRGMADPERMAVTGGSYGGFMTAWVISHDPRFRAAVAQRGVYDMIGFYSTTDIPRFTEREFGAAPWEDPLSLWQGSPLAHVEQIDTPLLLIHSDRDFRAPIPTAEGLFVALRRLQRRVELVRYPREGHELSRSGEPKHRVDRMTRILDWFDRFCQPSDTDE
jgi:dipeptidyl aminopeptidase/acylaminoacyl peptidase